MSKHIGDLEKGKVSDDTLLQKLYATLSNSDAPHKAYVMSPSEAGCLSSTANILSGGYYEKLFPGVSVDDLVTNISSESICGLYNKSFLYGIYQEQLRRDGRGKQDVDKDLFFYPIEWEGGNPVFKDVYRLQHHHPGDVVKTEPTSSYVDMSAYYGKVVDLDSQSVSLSAQFGRIANHIDSGLKRIASKIAQCATSRKILVYLHRYPAIGGIENVTTFLANAFVGLGHEIRIFSHFGMMDQSKGLSDAVDVVRLDKGGELRQVVSSWKPDLIIYQDSYAPIEKMLFYHGMSVPVVVCEHSSPFFCYTEPHVSGKRVRDLIERYAFPVVKQLKYLRDRVRRRYLYEKCWRYVLLSDRFFGEFRAVTRFAETAKLRAIPNAAPAVTHEVANKRNEVLFVGSVNRLKGCDHLVGIWGQIAPEFPDWELTIVGDGEMKDELEDRANRIGIPRINFEGWQADPSAYFARAKIFCFPSKREGWGLVLVEAQSHGCVPVAFESYSSIRDIITHGKNGLLVPTGDEAAMICALKRLIGDEKKLCNMSHAGKESALRYSVEKIICLWRELLGEYIA